MAIKHATTKSAGQKLFAVADWNVAHTFLQTDIDHNQVTNTHNLTTDIDHDQLLNFLASEHFIEASISHLNILNIGVNTHVTIDNHIADDTIHFVEGSISHLNITDIGTNTHIQIDEHIVLVNEHIDWTNATQNFETSGTGHIGDATNYIGFATDGEIALHGTARVNRHWIVDAKRFKLPGLGYPGESFEGLFYTLDFDKNAQEQGFLQEHVPFRWAVGTDMTVIVDWMFDNLDLGQVVWGLDYMTIKAGDHIIGFPRTITQTTPPGQSPGILIRTEFTTKISALTLETDDMLGIKFYRKAGDLSDTLNQDARLINVHFHFIQDKIGEAT